MNVPYNKSHSGSELVQKWMDKYFATKPEDCDNLFYHTEAIPNTTDIYLISFNQPMFISYQIQLIRLFFKTPYNLIVVDNNNDLHPEASRRVREMCGATGTIYLKAPNNHYQEQQHFDPTLKLGTTMSWLFHNVAKQRKPTYFGFLDHDCFLFRDWNPILYLDSMGMYGTPSQNGEKWNLHVISNFFKLNFVVDLPLDFRASYKHHLDTGGANYDILYHQFKIHNYRLPHVGVRYTDEDICRKDAVQHYEIVDNRWFHMCATSHDQLIGDGEKKLLYAKGFLDAVIRLNS